MLLVNSSMFSSMCKDTVNRNEVDPMITLDALHTTLGSLYKAEITVEPCFIPVFVLFEVVGLPAWYGETQEAGMQR